MRSHSVSAEGGTAAVLFKEDGDNEESHIYDTIKGSDFLADQDVAERLVKMMPLEIYQLNHWQDRSEEVWRILLSSGHLCAGQSRFL
jgi:succinate dehydrogenase / fumarate reductase flavoprotein subunit